MFFRQFLFVFFSILTFSHKFAVILLTSNIPLYFLLASQFNFRPHFIRQRITDEGVLSETRFVLSTLLIQSDLQTVYLSHLSFVH